LLVLVEKLVGERPAILTSRTALPLFLFTTLMRRCAPAAQILQ
jgi:hypothetical protein